mmetsp:Transcript_101192/g.179695  ORF Transcript_101192/g.179695 Transcript_101192/m.179695 type:complete len:321 (+) Transcript_101192:104-1066(+)
MCVALQLEDDQSFAFRFPDEEERDTFALVLGMFVDQRRTEVEEEEEEPQPQQHQQPTRSPLPAVPIASAGPAHAYQTLDFWAPTWCKLCQGFLSGVKAQGQECRLCKQVVCHSCARRGDPCRAAPASNTHTASAPSAGGGYAAPVPAAPASYPPASSARGVPEDLQDYEPETARGSSSSPSKSRGGKELTDGQKLVKRFVQKMVKGRELNMLSTTGRSLLCLVTLDREIRNLSIQLAGKKDAKQRFISLKSIEEISVGREVGEDIELPVDELSVTLVLAEGQAIAFQLDDEEERDTFAMCMGMFVDGNRKDAEKRKSKRK